MLQVETEIRYSPNNATLHSDKINITFDIHQLLLHKSG
jgi:hypothetical protein